MSDSSYGMNFNVGAVSKNGKIDAGVKYSDSNGFTFDKSYKDMDEDKSFDLVSKDLLSEYAKFTKQLITDSARAKREDRGVTSTPVSADSRLRELEETNRKLVEQNKRLQDRLAAKEQEQKNKGAESIPKKEEKPTDESPKRPKPVKTDVSYKKAKPRTESDAYRDMMRMLNDVFDGRRPRVHTYDDIERLWDKYIGW